MLNIFAPAMGAFSAKEHKMPFLPNDPTFYAKQNQLCQTFKPAILILSVSNIGRTNLLVLPHF